jgi:hypothetical protein
VKKTTRTDDLTTATASGTADPARARFSAAALTFIACVQLRDLNLLFYSKRRLLQFDFHVIAQIRTAASIFCPCTTATAEECLEDSGAKAAAAENLAENLERIMKSTASKSDTARTERRVTKAIVGRALVRIHKDIVRFT